jgi:enoyl-CoA hydratase/carnithine racemase
VRNPAAHHRAGPRGGAARQRPRHERGGGHAWGFYNTLHASGDPEKEAVALARSLADGPWFAHGITKMMLNQEWAMGIDEMIESEAQAQAICMATGDFRRAFEAFANKRKPLFEAN